MDDFRRGSWPALGGTGRHLAWPAVGGVVASARMIWIVAFLACLTLPVSAVDVMWKASGTVTGANSAFQVGVGNQVDLTIRYAPVNIIGTGILQQTSFTRKLAYHGTIRLRIEIRVGAKEWVSYMETTAFPLTNLLWNPFEVLSVDPSFPPSASAGDLITFRAYSFAGAVFERFNYLGQVGQRGILITAKDFVHPYNLLALGQFPDKTAQPSRISEMSGQVFADATSNAFTFTIIPGTVRITDYFPPVDLGIERSPLGGLHVTFTAESDGWYALYGSGDLKGWSRIGIHPGLLNGRRTIIVPTQLPQQFFRVERIPPPF